VDSSQEVRYLHWSSVSEHRKRKGQWILKRGGIMRDWWLGSAMKWDCNLDE
jgi:hypothetical protein